VTRRGPHVIVLGNEKGGSGKSTTAMHVIIALLQEGRRVGSIDLDSRQASLTRYIENRQATSATLDQPLSLPRHVSVARSMVDSKSTAMSEEAARLGNALGELADCEFIVIDTPGSDTILSRLGHGVADILITPLNDSFLDLDVLGRIEGKGGASIARPSVYSEAVWERRKQRAACGQPAIDWLVMRNRLSHLDAHNKREMERLIANLSKRIGFRIAPGLTERVVYRELFPRGLTLFDIGRGDLGIPWRMSHVAARQEVRDLVQCLNLAPKLGTSIERATGDHHQAVPQSDLPPIAASSRG
jgi:chromosome partitioning protein